MSITNLKLTKRALETLPPPANGKQQVYRDADVRQLYVYRYALSTSFVFDTTHRYKRVFETIGTYPQLSIQEARDEVHARLHKLARNTYPLGQNKTLQEIFETAYLDDMQLHKRNTQSELSKVRKHILPEFGSRRLKTLDRQSIVSFQRRLAEHLKPATVNKILSALSKMLTLAVEHGYLSVSPMNGLRQLKEHNERKRILSLDERSRFIDACYVQNSEASRSLLLSLYTGMRIGEVCSIEQAHLHLDEAYLILPTTKNGLPHQVALTSHAIRLIETQQLLVNKQRFLFPSSQSSSGYMSYPRHAFQRICAAAGISDLCIHDLRRTFATELMLQTGDIAMVAQALNHSSLQMAMRYQQRTTTHLIPHINATQQHWLSADIPLPTACCS
ncbi:Tyrosine recombinase XerC [compost metagenome]